MTVQCFLVNYNFCIEWQMAQPDEMICLCSCSCSCVSKSIECNWSSLLFSCYIKKKWWNWMWTSANQTLARLYSFSIFIEQFSHSVAICWLLSYFVYIIQTEGPFNKGPKNSYAQLIDQTKNVFECVRVSSSIAKRSMNNNGINTEHAWTTISFVKR